MKQDRYILGMFMFILRLYMLQLFKADYCSQKRRPILFLYMALLLILCKVILRNWSIKMSTCLLLSTQNDKWKWHLSMYIIVADQIIISVGNNTIAFVWTIVFPFDVKMRKTCPTQNSTIQKSIHYKRTEFSPFIYF